jgi:ribosome biogenesis GTPase A
MWVRLGGLASDEQESAIEMLDSPGIIPARQFDQEGAVKLAICNDIGEASYDRVIVAASMCDRINAVHKEYSGYIDMQRICER